MSFYSYLYRPIQNLIIFLFVKKDFNIQVANFFKKNDYDEIHEIGCSDGSLLQHINLKNKKYYGYDVDLANINKAKKKYTKKNINFYCKSIDDISIKNKKKKLFILIGVFHHINDNQILNFGKKLTKREHVIALDGFYHKNQNIFDIFMKKLDKGDFIRTYSGYKKVLPNFILRKKISIYLRFFSHLASFKNIDKKKIDLFF